MPAPRIIYEGDEAAAHRHLPVAQNLLHKVRMSAAASGSGVTGLAHAPDSDSYIYALKVGDTEVLHIFSAPSREVLEPEVKLVPQLPDFLSGVTRLGLIQTREIRMADGSVREIQVLKDFKPNVETGRRYDWPVQWREMARLAVRPWVAFNAPDNPAVSQYQIVSPSMYSGRMRKLVQVVQGYGRLPGSRIPQGSYDRAWQLQHGIQVRFDYRFYRTHSLYRADDGVQWLVETSMNNGVIAMRLPIYEGSEKLKNSPIESIAVAATEFGGLPTGIAFPAGARLQRAIATGAIIRLATAAELQDFYRLQPYSTSMGWSFNERGDEAHNTGWYWHVDGVRRACHYALNIRIGPLKKHRQPNEPIADGVAILSKVAEDFLFHPSVRSPPPIKFHEPLLGGLLSVEMFAQEGADVSTGHIPGMDVTMHAMWIDDRVAVVRYYWNRIDSKPDILDPPYEECTYRGGWARTETVAYVGQFLKFYTTFEDDRESFYTVRREFTRASADLGWQSPYFVSDDLGNPRFADVFRRRAFRRRDKRVEFINENAGCAVVIPNGIRDGYVYYYYKGNEGSSTVESVNYDYLADPTSYRTFRSLFVPPPEDSCYERLIRHVIGSSFGGNVCQLEFANEGAWLATCDAVGDGSSGPLRTPYILPTINTPPSYSAQCRLYTNSDLTTINLPAPVESRTAWLAKSPDPDFGFVQQFLCYHSCFGVQHIAYTAGLNVVPLTFGGPLLANESPEETRTVNFLGVL
jgi:hypothetical protein